MSVAALPRVAVTSPRAQRWAVTAMATCAVVWTLTAFRHPEALYDPGTYRRAALAWLAGVSPFAATDYRYWPAFAALVAPTTRLPVVLYDELTLLVDLAVLATTALLLWRWTGAPWRWTLAVCAGPVALLALSTGNASILVYGLAVAGLVTVRERPIMGGALLGLVALKPDLLPLVLPVLLSGRRRALWGFAVGVAVWPVLSVVTSGPPSLVAMAQTFATIDVTAAGMVHTGGWLSYVGPGGWASHAWMRPLGVLAMVSTLMLSAVVLVYRIRAGRPLDAGEVAVWTAILVLAMPYAMAYDLLFLVPVLLTLRSLRMTVAWWLLPIAMLPLAGVLGGATIAVLPPLVAVVTFAAWRGWR